MIHTILSNSPLVAKNYSGVLHDGQADGPGLPCLIMLDLFYMYYFK
jgi:hypothetical protein